MDFFSREAGQARRAWLNDKDRAVSQLMRRYLGPTGIPERLEALGGLLSYTDAGDMVEAADASRALWNDPTIENVGRYATAGAAMMLPFVGGKAAAELSDNATRWLADEDGAIRAWHGSPHDFDRFSLDKIGTGEGAQAYGHGLYFAESPDVARTYKESLSAMKFGSGELTPAQEARIAVNSIFAGDAEAAKRAFRYSLDSGATPDEILPKVAARLKALEDGSWEEATVGRLYEVSIDANPEDFLDWDAPLSAQPKINQLVNDWAEQGWIYPQDPSDTAGQFVKGLEGGDWQQKEFLNAGIPGIRYLDAGSRGAGDGSRNYVVFDDKLISILNKYGLLGAMMGGGALSQMPQGEQQ